MMKTFTLYVHGMHCQSCVVLTESELCEDPRISQAKTNLLQKNVEITGDFGDLTLDQVAMDLTNRLKVHGYTLSTEPEKAKVAWDEFATAVPAALLLVGIFLLLQKVGIVNLVSTGSGSYVTAFVVGIVASLSTCMAVVGGLVLSLSATAVKNDQTIQPHLLFHISRIVSFFVLGGAIGVVGSAFVLGQKGTFVMSLVVGIVMLIMGLNLLEVFHGLKKIQPAMPKWLSKKAFGAAKINHSLTPILAGMATFFLPCGFTQSMQIYSLSTGNFIQGALTMFFFSLGTLPVLSLVSASSFSIKDATKSGVFFKTAGIVVIMFALFNILNSFVTIGLIKPFINL